jgi:hypothetical protein
MSAANLREIRTRATKIANAFRKIKAFDKVHAPRKTQGGIITPWVGYEVELEYVPGGTSAAAPEHYYIEVRGVTLGDIHVDGGAWAPAGMIHDIRAAAVNAVR